MIRLIALDVDGTLLNPEGKILPETVKAIAEAREKGCRVVLATGRSAPEAVYFAAQAGCDSLAVCLGGGVLADAVTGKHLKRWDMDRETGRKVLEQVTGAPVSCMVFAGEVNLMDRASAAFFQAAYPYDCFHEHTTVVDDVPGYLEEHDLPLTKLFAVGDPTCFEEITAGLRQLPQVELTSSGRENFEVVPRGVDKGMALTCLADMWGISMEETGAVGDSDNDRAMLRVVGRAVAMGNACDALKAEADYVTASNKEDGVAQAIRYLLAH